MSDTDETQNEAHANIEEQIVKLNQDMEFLKSHVIQLTKYADTTHKNIHRIHRASRFEMVEEMLSAKKRPENQQAELTDIAKAFLVQEMDTKLFLFLTRNQRKELTDAKKNLRKDTPIDKLRRVYELEGKMYENAKARRRLLDGVEYLSVAIKSLLPPIEVEEYEKDRRDLVDTRDLTLDQVQNKIKHLAAKHKTWRDNLSSIYALTKHIWLGARVRKQSEIYKHTDPDTQAKLKRLKTNVMMKPTEDKIMEFLKEDKSLGKYWVRVLQGSESTYGVINDIQKKTLIASLKRAAQSKKGAVEGQVFKLELNDSIIEHNNIGWFHCYTKIYVPDFGLFQLDPDYITAITQVQTDTQYFTSQEIIHLIACLKEIHTPALNVDANSFPSV